MTHTPAPPHDPTMPLGQPAATSLGEVLADLTGPPQTAAPLGEVLADLTALPPAAEPLADALADLTAPRRTAPPLGEALAGLTMPRQAAAPLADALADLTASQPTAAAVPAPAAAPVGPAAVDGSGQGRPAARLRRGGGTVLALLGVLLVASAAWLELGTGWLASRSQAELAAELEAGTDDVTVVDFSAVEDPAMDGPIPDAEPADNGDDEGDGDEAGTDTPPAPEANSDHGAPDGAGLGDPVAQITIPEADVDHTVVVGVGDAQLTAGPGWAEASARPGTVGNTVISGHRTTYGAPFRRLDRLEPGDEIIVSQPDRPDAVYEMRDAFLVDPDEVSVTAPTDGARLTLTTCHPVGSDAERLVIQAELVDGEHAEHALDDDAWTPFDGDRREP